MALAGVMVGGQVSWECPAGPASQPARAARAARACSHSRSCSQRPVPSMQVPSTHLLLLVELEIVHHHQLVAVHPAAAQVYGVACACM